MKNSIVILFFLVQCYQPAVAQINWQIGTTWHLNSGQNPWTNGILYSEMKLVKDTILGSLSGFELSGECNCIFGSQPKFVRQADRKIWYWDDTQWELLYDFTMQTGDSLFVRFKGINQTDSILVVIDSVKSINLNNGQAIQVQYISRYLGNDHSYFADHGFRWIEGIGSDMCLFPQSPSCSPGAGLVCFDSNNLQFSWSGLSCDVITSIETPKMNRISEIKIQPNPFKDKFQVFLPNEQVSKLEIISITGQKYSVNWIQNNQTIEVNTEGLSNGLYFLRLLNQDNTQWIAKMLKSSEK
jgi:Secretion system C-terminal sorting domain